MPHELACCDGGTAGGEQAKAELMAKPNENALKHAALRRKRLLSSCDERMARDIRRKVREMASAVEQGGASLHSGQANSGCWSDLPQDFIADILKVSCPKMLRLLNRHWCLCVDSNVEHLRVIGAPHLLPAVAHKFTCLKSLTVRHLFHCEDLQQLGQCKNLTKLDLHWLTTIEDESMEYLSTLTSLTELNLERCERITDDGLKCVSSLTNLCSLSLGWTQISGDGLKHLAMVPDLEELDLRYCRNLTDECLKELAPHTNLKTLNLARCNIQSLRHISQLVGLRVLGLFGTLVGDDGFRYVSSLVNLRVLHLDCSFIDDHDLQHLLPLPNLKKLTLQPSGVSGQCLSCLSIFTNLSDLDVCRSCTMEQGLQGCRRNQLDIGFRNFFSG